MDDWQKKRQDILGKNAPTNTPNQSSANATWQQKRQQVLKLSPTSQNNITGTTWQDRRQQVLQQSKQKQQVPIETAQEQQKRQQQESPIQTAEKVGQGIVSNIGNFFKNTFSKQAVEKPIQDIKNKASIQKTLGDIPLFGAIISNEQKLGQDIGEAISLQSIKGKIAQSKMDHGTLVRMIAQYNNATDQKTKNQLWNKLAPALNIKENIFGKPDTIPLAPKTALQYGADVAGVGLDTLIALNPEFAGVKQPLEQGVKSFLESLLEKKVLAKGAAIGGAYGGLQSVAGGQTNITDILSNAGANAILFPATEVVAGGTSKLVNLVKNQFTKKVITDLSNTTTQKEASKVITDTVNTVIDKAQGNKEVLTGTRDALQSELTSYTPEVIKNDKELTGYTQTLQANIDKIDAKLGTRRPLEQPGSTKSQTVPISQIETGLSDYITKNANTATPKIKEYEQVLRNGGSLEPIPVYLENGKYVLNKDGFHRLQAYKNAGRTDVAIRVESKTELSASAKQREENQPRYKVIDYTKKPSFNSAQSRAVQKTFNERLDSIRSNSDTAEQLTTQTSDAINTALTSAKGDKTVLAGIRTSLNKEMFGFVGMSGNYKADYAALQTMKTDPEVGGYLQMLEDNIAKIDEQINKPVTEEQKPLTPIGKGETRISKLAQGVEEKAIESKLTDEFKGLPEYKQVNLKDQAKKAADILEATPDKALAIAMGEELPPHDVLPESVFVAVEQQAIKNGDVQTLRELATSSNLSTQATAMGQRIRALGERDPNSPTSIIRKITESRESQIKNKLKGKSITEAKNKVVDNIKKSIQQNAPKKEDWLSFIDSIQC